MKRFFFYFLSPTKKNWKHFLNYEKKLVKQQNTLLLDIFLDFYVNIFGDLYQYIKPSRTFNKKKYLESYNDSDFCFYRQVLCFLNKFIF